MVIKSSIMGMSICFQSLNDMVLLNSRFLLLFLLLLMQSQVACDKHSHRLATIPEKKTSNIILIFLPNDVM
jgi:hypothetical protein